MTLNDRLKQLRLTRDPLTGVGKLADTRHSLHRSCEAVLPNALLIRAKAQLPKTFDYTIVRHDRALNSLTFIESENWDASPEPLVGDRYTIFRDGSFRFRNASLKTQIIHHPWLYVRDDYQGFDVQQSKLRSLQWRSLLGLDYARLGYQEFWQQSVLPQLETSPC
jgi:hypothetical protein